MLALAALLTVLVEYGFDLTLNQEKMLLLVVLAIVFVFLFETLLKLFLSTHRRLFFRRRLADFILILLFPVLSFVFGRNSVTPVKVYLLWSQGYLLGVIGLRALRLNKALVRLRLSPAKLVVYSFVLGISFGTLLLCLPRSTPPDRSIRVIDALFTATSALCVTGLVVVDTGKDFSFSGQLVILTLIQLGGLGIMTFSAAFALLTGLGLGLKDRSTLQSILGAERMGSIGKLVVSILIVTFLSESIGFILLVPTMLNKFGFPQGVFHAMFHSVSAFCNAGFSLYSENLEGFYANIPFCLVIMSLIVLGGLGFPVLIELLTPTAWRRPQRKIWKRFSVHTRLVVSTSLILILLGAVFIYFNPTPVASPARNGIERITASLFQSVTTRTAGFNTVRISSFGLPVILVMICLMFVGASPASTGGGVKTTTLAVFLLKIRAMLRGHSHTEIWSRRIPFTVVETAGVVVFLAAGLIATSVLLLSMTEDASLCEIIFEEVSAFGTVGLSLGLTPKLTDAGKIVIIISMLVGRLGPITLVMSLAQPKREAGYDLPDAPVMIG